MRIFDNLLYKLTALLVASSLWLVAQGFSSVKESLDLPIVIEDLPKKLVLLGQSVGEVNVTIEGSRAAVRAARKSLLRYPISLDGAKSGQRSVPISKDRIEALLPRGASILARAPSAVVLQIEPVISKRVRVRVDWVGEPPPGYQVTGVSVEPKELKLEGARKTVLRLREIVTERVDVSHLRVTTVQEVPLSLDLAYVWRAGEDRGKPVRVVVHVERIPETDEKS
ncbi:MAG: hypothetical protein IH800_02180 [Myxococcales bacterium]|nr:hypothetical protein [Myxococcales bacterium]